MGESLSVSPIIEREGVVDHLDKRVAQIWSPDDFLETLVVTRPLGSGKQR